MASVCPASRLNETLSSATTRPPPVPKACRSPSAESIDTRGQVFHIERLDEIPRVPEVEHVDQRLHAHVGGRHDHREGGMGGADLLEQSHAIGVREAEVEHQDFGAECFELPAGLAPARGEGNLVPIGEESVIGPPQRHLILDEQYFAPPRGRPGLFRLGAWTSSSLPPPVGSSNRRQYGYATPVPPPGGQS